VAGLPAEVSERSIALGSVTHVHGVSLWFGSFCGMSGQDSTNSIKLGLQYNKTGRCSLEMFIILKAIENTVCVKNPCFFFLFFFFFITIAHDSIASQVFTILSC